MTRKTAGASASGPRGRSTASDGLGAAAVVRGASRGFTVLVLGGLLTPVVAAGAPAVVTQSWVVLVAVVAFSLAGARAGATERPWLHGAAAAVGSFTLLVPLWLLTRGDSSPIQMLLTLVLALVVGGLSGAISGRAAATAGARV